MGDEVSFIIFSILITVTFLLTPLNMFIFIKILYSKQHIEKKRLTLIVSGVYLGTLIVWFVYKGFVDFTPIV